MNTNQPNVKLVADDEEFKTVRIYDKYYPNYLISNYGRLYSLNCNMILSQRIDKNGYVRYRLSEHSKLKYISGQRLVAFAFVPNPHPDKFNTVNHLDEFDKTNNKWTNLEWTNDKGNLNYGTAQKRRAAQRTKKVLQFDLNNNLIAEFNSLPEIKAKLGYNGSVICRHIKNGVSYDGYYWYHAI